MSDQNASSGSTVAQTASEPYGYLTNGELDRLTAYKWRYSLESHGFSSAQAYRLLFVKWLHGRGALHS